MKISYLVNVVMHSLNLLQGFNVFTGSEVSLKK